MQALSPNRLITKVIKIILQAAGWCLPHDSVSLAMPTASRQECPKYWTGFATPDGLLMAKSVHSLGHSLSNWISSLLSSNLLDPLSLHKGSVRRCPFIVFPLAGESTLSPRNPKD